MPDRSYAAAEKYILSREFFGMKLGLANITEFLDSIGCPQTKYKTIHIAGTNGKGSTAALLESVLRAQGFKTGLFTSPHLVSLRERIRVNGKMIPTSSVAAFIGRYRRVLSRRKLSFFELITAMALEHFARTGVEIAVVETGLGGRLDASNVLTPEMTITTDISRDHVEILGSSIRKIAREKAGIIKPGVPHLIGMLPEPAADVMRQRCTQLKAPLYKLTGGNVSFHPEAMSLDFRHNGLAIRGLKPSLVGVYQLKNTALALKAVAILRNRGWRVSKRAIVKGIRGTVWPGRFEIREYRGKPTHIFDVSHNASGVASFVETYKLIFGERKAKIITGFVKRKEHQKMFDSLSTIAESYALVPLRTGRSVELSEMVSSINWRGVPYRRHGSLKSAYSKVLNSSANDDVVIVIGSHYLVGEFYNWYKRR